MGSRRTSKTEIPPGALDMLILDTLARLGRMHGYGIAQHIQRTSRDVLEVEEGSLYPALQACWLRDEWRPSGDNRTTIGGARFYTLTEAGRRQLSAEVSRFDHVMQAIARVIRPAEGA
jgi:transcriptional regulator